MEIKFKMMKITDLLIPCFLKIQKTDILQESFSLIMNHPLLTKSELRHTKNFIILKTSSVAKKMQLITSQEDIIRLEIRLLIKLKKESDM